MRVIDADALMEDIKSNAYIIRDVFNSTDEGMSVNGIQYAIDHAPTIQTTRTVGEWERISFPDGDVMECTNCGYRDWSDVWEEESRNFCPNCGAYMRGDNK